VILTIGHLGTGKPAATDHQINPPVAHNVILSRLPPRNSIDDQQHPKLEVDIQHRNIGERLRMTAQLKRFERRTFAGVLRAQLLLQRLRLLQIALRLIPFRP
jgi:hypothetical protein